MPFWFLIRDHHLTWGAQIVSADFAIRASLSVDFSKKAHICVCICVCLNKRRFRVGRDKWLFSSEARAYVMMIKTVVFIRLIRPRMYQFPHTNDYISLGQFLHTRELQPLSACAHQTLTYVCVVLPLLFSPSPDDFKGFPSEFESFLNFFEKHHKLPFSFIDIKKRKIKIHQFKVNCMCTELSWLVIIPNIKYGAYMCVLFDIASRKCIV